MGACDTALAVWRHEFLWKVPTDRRVSVGVSEVREVAGNSLA